MSTWKVLLYALVAAAIIVPAAAPAYGHALPAQYSIAPNTIIHDRSQVPPQLTISFSERPDPKVSHIQVLDSKNERVDGGDFKITGENGRQASVTLDRAKIADGVYSVSWLTMSLDDGHIAEGGYVFGVCDVTVPRTGGQGTTTYVTSFADALAKWPLIVAQAAAVGMVGAHIALGKKMPARPRRLGRLLVACAAAMAGSATGLLFLQAASLAGTGAPFGEALQSLAFASPSGMVWLVRLASASVIAGLAAAFLARAKRPLLLGVLAVGAASILSNSVLSHNSAAPFLPWVAVAADWVHFVAVSAWVGGLFYLAAIFVPEAKRAPDAARVLAIGMPRFSLVATASLGVVGVTGIYMAWLHLHGLYSLFASEYGSNLIIKLAAALPVVLLGTYHQIRLHRSMVSMATADGQSRTAVVTFGRTIKVEAILAVGVLLAASLLTVTSPPDEVMHGYMHKATIEGVDTTIEISPFQAGFNTFTVTFMQNGAPPSNIHHVMIRFTNEDAGIGPVVAMLDSTGNSAYSGTGGYLSQKGSWKIDLIAQRMNAYDLNYSFTEELGSTLPSQAGPTLDSFAWLAIVLAAAVVGGSAAYVVQSRRQLRKTVAALEKRQ
jgi:putative copper export protein/methionine-rich copper-binding protein CopC